MTKTLFTVMSAMLLSNSLAFAQNQAVATPVISSSGILLTIIILMALVLLFQSVVIRRLTGLVHEQQYKIKHGKEMPIEEEATREIKKRDDVLSNLWKSLTRSNPAGKQKDVMLDHNYDGIQELDNIMPPWLQLILYGTIVFAVIYILIYHVYDTGKLPKEEYAYELQMAQQQKDARLKLVGASVDETSVKQLTDAASLGTGKTIFIARCSPCHGQLGEGNVGPNFTDDYWLHGGTVNDIFKTVKYGVPAKGMVPWQGVLKPEEMQDVVSYVMSLHGTNPPNAKAPQGVLFTPSAASDSTVAKNDSTTAKTDTIKVKS